jgi:hypothetical protein
MSNILGNILVKLGFDGAGFFSGMTKAEAVAKSSGKEIEGAFRGVGSAVEVALAPLSEFGAIVGAAFDKIGSSAASALESGQPDWRGATHRRSPGGRRHRDVNRD